MADEIHGSSAARIPTETAARGVSHPEGWNNRRRTPALELAIGAAVRQVREDEGLSQADVAKRLGVTFQAVQRFENGKSRVSLSTAISLCRALDLPLSRLIEAVEANAADNARVTVVLTKTAATGGSRQITYDTRTAPLEQIASALARDIREGERSQWPSHAAKATGAAQ